MQQEMLQDGSPQSAPAAPQSPPLADLCANVRSSFDRLAIFAEQHDLSYSVAAFYVLVGSLNILPLDGGRMVFEPVPPAASPGWRAWSPRPSRAGAASSPSVGS